MTFWLVDAGRINLTNSNPVCSEYAACPGSSLQCCMICSNMGYRGKCQGTKCCCEGSYFMQHSSTFALCQRL